MEQRYSLILVSDETSPIRRFDVRRSVVRRGLWGAGIVAVLLLGLFADYVWVRLEHRELEVLRAQNALQSAKIASFDETVSGVESTLARMRELERKVRIIANLPGSAASGGADITAVGASEGGDIDAAQRGDGGPTPTGEEALPTPARAPRPTLRAPNMPGDGRVSLLRREAERLGYVAKERVLSLKELVDQLEDKHQRLATSPAVWPAQGWLTSRFGTRISPFTGRRQFHAGIDIAGAPGTDVVATARGKVIFAGSKGPLGQTVILDHGYGVRTHYGHNKDVRVSRGDRVERGSVVASLGSTGRSTGPHLHYTVEVKGKAVNPLDYIFD